MDPVHPYDRQGVCCRQMLLRLESPTVRVESATPE